MDVKRIFPLVAVLVAVCSVGVANENEVTDSNARRFAARTVYLQNAVEGYHQLHLYGKLGGKAKLELDPNKCSLDSFGDTTTCTRMAIRVVDVTLSQAKIKDPTGQGRLLYMINDTGLKNLLMLVVWPESDCPARFIYIDRSDKTPRPISLEPSPLDGKDDHGKGDHGKNDHGKADHGKDDHGKGGKDEKKAELCVGKYSAQQVPGAVLIFACGVHPTGGYKTYFKKSPIEIYPPQFILMHEKPDGFVTQVITPFMVYTQFNAEEKIDEVFVHDANGKHRVPVEQVPDLK